MDRHRPGRGHSPGRETEAAGLKEGEPRLFHSNLLLIRSSGLVADYGTITSGEEHYYAWKTLSPKDDSGLQGMNAQEQLIAGMLKPVNLLTILRTCSVFMALLTIIDCIVAHELCHLRHRDHSDPFWNEVDKILPDYRDRKEWLRTRGAELNL